MVYRNDYVTAAELREMFREAASMNGGTVELKYRYTTEENAIGDPGTAGSLIIRGGRRIPDRDLGSEKADGITKILEALDADEEQREEALRSPHPINIRADLRADNTFWIRRIWCG